MIFKFKTNLVCSESVELVKRDIKHSRIKSADLSFVIVRKPVRQL